MSWPSGSESESVSGGFLHTKEAQAPPETKYSSVIKLTLQFVTINK